VAPPGAPRPGPGPGGTTDRRLDPRTATLLARGATVQAVPPRLDAAGGATGTGSRERAGERAIPAGGAATAAGSPNDAALVFIPRCTYTSQAPPLGVSAGCAPPGSGPARRPSESEQCGSTQPPGSFHSRPPIPPRPVPPRAQPWKGFVGSARAPSGRFSPGPADGPARENEKALPNRLPGSPAAAIMATGVVGAMPRGPARRRPGRSPSPRGAARAGGPADPPRRPARTRPPAGRERPPT
jgi:hypothetical protein